MSPLTRRNTPVASDHPDNQRIEPGEAELGEIEIVHEHQLAAGKTARFYNDIVRIRAPDGRYQEARQLRLRRAPDHEDGVIAVPIRDGDDRILLVRQFRHAARMWLRELPRGARERGESPEQTLRRELREEIGCATTSVRHLGRIAPDGAQLETVPFILAATVQPAGEPEREPTETIDRVIPYTYSDLRAACQNGDVIDGYTIAAVLRLEPLFDGDRYLGRD